MRRLLILASTMVLFDVAFYSAIAPLLPDYVSDLGLSKAEAGILSAAYAAGTLVASLPAGLLASRAGPRRTVIGGLMLLGVASVAFGFAHHIVLLDVARFGQGIAGALIWSGALTWLITAAPDERRGSVIGTALGTAVAGALIGPALGALAAEVGTEEVFSAVLAISTLLAFLALRTPDSGTPERQSSRELADAVLTRPVVMATAFVAIPSMMFGVSEVVVPLRIHDLGGGHALIAGGFIGAAALEAALAPIAGRYSDRVGRALPFSAGLTVAGAAMVVIGVSQTLAIVVAGLLLSSFGGGICFAPALTLLSETAEASHVHQGLAAGLSNMAWASGQVVGGLAGGAVAGVAGYAVPTIAVALIVLATAAYARNVLPTFQPRPQEG
jgi:MFS family permease